VSTPSTSQAEQGGVAVSGPDQRQHRLDAEADEEGGGDGEAEAELAAHQRAEEDGAHLGLLEQVAQPPAGVVAVASVDGHRPAQRWTAARRSAA
jgi:hypothetical protein